MSDLISKEEIDRIVVQAAISGRPMGNVNDMSSKLPYPSLAVTRIGPNRECASEVKRLLEEKGCNVYRFHVKLRKRQGYGAADRPRLSCGPIEIVPAGVIEELFRGNRVAGMERLDVLMIGGMSVVLAPFTSSVTRAGPTQRLRDRFIDRRYLALRNFSACRYDRHIWSDQEALKQVEASLALGRVAETADLVGDRPLDSL